MDDRLAISVTLPSGAVERWGGDEPNAQDIPGDLTFSTKIPGGDAELSCSLLRRIDLDYSDQPLFGGVRVYGPGNREAWRGRLAQFPRSHGDGYQITPGAVGLSAMFTDDPSFQEIYVDRDFGHWGAASTQRRINGLASSQRITDSTATPDDTTGQPSLLTAFAGVWTAASRGASEAFYKVGAVPIGSLYYAWKRNSNVDNGDANWTWQADLSTDDVITTTNSSGNLRAGGPGTGTTSTSGAAKKFAVVRHYYGGGAGGADNTEYAIYWTCLAVYGTHGLTKQGTDSATSAKGFYAPDIVRDIVTRTAPLLTLGEFGTSTFVVPHCVFDQPTTGENAILAVNAYLGWDWGVYDGAFFYRATDPTRLCWQARLSDGARLDLEGETAEQIYNGVYCTYTDPAGQTKTVGPPAATADNTDASLVDTSSTNPINAMYGSSYKRWLPFNISQVTTLAGATQLGVIALAEHNAPQRRGTLTLTGSATHPTEGQVPVWRVRAGDYIRISDHPADVPRKIISTQYTHGSRTISLALENTPFVLGAILARFGSALTGVL